MVFGPHPRDYSSQMPKKMRRLALRSALSAKLAEGQIKVVDQLSIDAISTRQFVGIMEKLGVKGKTMLVLAQPDDTLRKSARNVPWMMLRISPAISTYDLLNSDTVIFTKEALDKLEEAQAK